MPPTEIDWIPVDRLAQSILDLIPAGSLASKEHDRLEILKLVNPHVMEWSSLVPAIQKRFGRINLTTAPLPEWVKLLRADELTDSEELALKLAMKVVEFFEQLE